MSLISLAHLRNGLSSARLHYTQLISDLATATDEAIEELSKSQISKPETFTAGNVLVTDTDGNFVDGGVSISIVSGKVRITYDDGN